MIKIMMIIIMIMMIIQSVNGDLFMINEQKKETQREVGLGLLNGKVKRGKWGDGKMIRGLEESKKG